MHTIEANEHTYTYIPVIVNYSAEEASTLYCMSFLATYHLENKPLLLLLRFRTK